MTHSKSRKQGAKASTIDPELQIRGSRLRLFGVALICAYVALVPLVFDPAADWPFTVPKALLSHALAYALAGVTAGLLIRFGGNLVVWSWLHVPIVMFLVVNVAASIVAEDRVLALYGSHARMLGLGTIAAWTMLYFAVVLLVRTRADFVAIAAAGLGAAVGMLGYELVQLLGRDPFAWSIDTASRPFSTNGQPTTLASYFTVLAVSAFAVALAADAVPRWLRGVLVVFAGALLAGAAATATRSAVVGLATGSTVLVGFVWLRHPNRRAKAIAGVAGVGATVALAALLTLTPIGGRVLQQTAPAGGDSEETSLFRLDLASLDVRALLYQIAIEVVRERPILGYGPDNFVVGMTRHRPEKGPDEARLAHATSPHSWVAQVATSSGLIGLGAFVAIIVTALSLTARGVFRGVTAASVTALTAYLGTGLTTVNDVGTDWVFWVSAAFIATSTAKIATTAESMNRHRGASRDRRTVRSSGASRSSLVLATVCVALGVGAALTTVSAMSASRAAKSSETSRLLSQVSRSIELGLAATSSDPLRAQYWDRLGLAYVGGARWRDASNALDRAIQLAPWDVRYISDLIQTQLVLALDGDAAARARVIQLADDGVRRDPNFPDIHYTRAVVMQFTGNIPEAVRAIERAFVLAPQSRNGSWYVTATQLYVATGRPSDAIRVAHDGLALVGSPSSALQLRLELARAYLAAGQPQDALAQLDAILAIEPTNLLAQRLRSEIQSAPK